MRCPLRERIGRKGGCRRSGSPVPVRPRRGQCAGTIGNAGAGGGVVVQQGQLFGLAAGVLEFGDLMADALQFLAQGRDFGVHPGFVKLADTAQLALHQLQAGGGNGAGFDGHGRLLSVYMDGLMGWLCRDHPSTSSG